MNASRPIKAHGREAPSPSPLLEVNDLNIVFPGVKQAVMAVSNLSFRIQPGQILAMVGESGAGKTLAARALLGLLPAAAHTSGSVRWQGQELSGLQEREWRRYRGSEMAMIFQDPAQALNPCMRIGRQITETMIRHCPMDWPDARAQTLALLETLQFSEPEQHYRAYPHQLSGGMQQRAMIALGMAANPSLLIADEATRSLDPATQSRILSRLLRLQRERRMALLLITHDLRQVAQHADEVLVMQGGHKVEHGKVRQVMEAPRHPYTQQLVKAFTPCYHWRPTQKTRSQPLLVVDHLVQDFAVAKAGDRAGSIRALDAVSFTLHEGEVLGIIGESGAGKSSLARALLQIPRPQSGSVVFQGHDLTRLKRRALSEKRCAMQLVFQDACSAVNPRWRVARIVEEPLLGHGLGSRGERQRRVEAVLAQVGLPMEIYGRRYPAELSGGQCQRVVLARALVSNPALLVFDEALSSLDHLTQMQMLALLQRLREQFGLSYLFISHDLHQIRHLSDRVAVMQGGRICQIGDVRSVLQRHEQTETFRKSQDRSHEFHTTV